MRYVEIKRLPDGSGRVRVHWIVPDQNGPLLTSTSAVPSDQGIKLTPGIRVRIACLPRQDTFSELTSDNGVKLTLRSDDPRAVTCPECQKTSEYQAARRLIEEINQAASVPEGVNEEAADLASVNKDRG